MPAKIPEPWLSFLHDVDRALARSVAVHCLGGFVLTVLWELPRPTGDVDFIEIEPAEAASELLRIARWYCGAGSSPETHTCSDKRGVPRWATSTS